MLDIVIFETAQNVHDCVYFADIAKELVAEAFALRRPFDQAGNIDKGELGFDNLGAARDFRNLLQPRIGHRDLADIGLDRAKRIIGRLRRLCFGQCIEKR